MRTASRTTGSRATRLLAIAAVAGAALVATTTSASAAPEAPPGWQGGPGSYVVFTLGSYAVAEDGVVDLVRDFDGADLLGSFSNWSDPAVAGGAPGWPTSFSASGVSLTRNGHCDYTAPSCSYTVTGGSGSEFWVAAATADAGGVFPIDVNTTPHGTVTVAPPTTQPTTPPQPVVIVGTVIITPGASGNTYEFDAEGSNGGATPIGGYHWTIIGGPEGSQDFTCPVTPTRCPSPPGVVFTPGTSYRVTLDLVDQSGAPISGAPPAEAGGLNIPPAPPSNGGGGGGTPGPGNGTPPANNPTTPAPGADVPDVFAPQAAPVALTRNRAASVPTIIWLWQPDWYQSSTLNRALESPKAQLETKGATDITVSAPSSGGSSAGVWAAGLGAFALVGGLWFLSRRRAREAELF